MSLSDVPQFPRGFLLADYPIEAPSSFVPGPLLDNFYVHPWTNVRVAGNRDLFVIILGHCVPTSPDQNDDPANDLLACLRISEGNFLRELNRSEGHTSELQSRFELVCRLLLEKKKQKR